MSRVALGRGVQLEHGRIPYHGAEYRRRRYHQGVVDVFGQLAPVIDAYSAYSKRKKILTKDNMPLKRRRVFRRSKRRTRGVIRKRLPRSLTTRTKLIRCRLVDSFQATHAAGAMERYLISMTNIVDPLGGGSANQPLGYDQWKTLYDKAKILGAKVKMTVHNSGTAEPIIMGLNPRYPNSSTSLADWEYNVEVAGSKSRILSQDVDHGTLVMSKSTKKMLNLKNLKDSTDIECDIGSDTGPSLSAYIEAWTQPFDKASATTADVIIQVDYIVMLYDPIVPARSSG